jgi:hypothetical protein
VAIAGKVVALAELTGNDFFGIVTEIALALTAEAVSSS